ncbi:MAG: hypothetical protein Pg6C_02800 [Treponemataceae bacterium]|nr:MAG: hypothetical protein Pg6C_02800 [Treponemataceae bacterium]
MLDVSDLDPEIAALLVQTETQGASYDDAVSGDDDFDSIETDGGQVSSEQAGLPRKTFEPIIKFFADNPLPIFDDPAYYKTALSGENETANRLHTVLSKYLQCQDPKDRGVFRPQVTTAYWEFLKSLAPKMASRSLPRPKQMLARFGVLLPKLFLPEHKQLLSTVIMENTTDEPVYYLDEWFAGIGTGRIELSATDESRPKKTAGGGSVADEQQRLMQLQSKNQGMVQTIEGLLTDKEIQRDALENELKANINTLCAHNSFSGGDRHKNPLSESQKRSAMDAVERVKQLLRIDKEIAGYLREYQEAADIGRSLESKLTDMPEDVEIDKADVLTEADTVRQMAKMTIGRQGNHFPIFTKEYFHCTPRSTGTRENVIALLAWIESVDPGVFVRVNKNTPMRIVPYVLLLPTYGDFGVCWEPFNRYNRLTSRGRIVVPMYSKSLQIAVIGAAADLRWQVAKEKAAYYWMEEGLTGQFYQWFTEQKLKGDIKDAFVENYTLWLTKESEGVQRLDKDLRGIFWRHMPFTRETKEKLKGRSMAYAELFQRDKNREMSDGY